INMPAQGRLDCADGSGGSFFSQCLALCVPAALLSSGLVLVDYAFVGNTVDDGNGGSVSCFCVIGIAFLNGCDHFLDVGTHHRAQAAVVETRCFCLLSALARLFRVRHRKTTEYEP